MRLLLLFASCILHSIHDDDGDNERDFIYNGGPAKEGQAPYQCSLQYTKIHICGCAVLNKYFVLTASHCFFERGTLLNVENIRIKVGSNSLKEGGKYYPADRLIPHENFGDFSNDVALVKVRGPIEFKENVVEPIELGVEDVEDSAEVLLTGWGDVDRYTQETPDQLQYVMLNVLNKESCILEATYGHFIKGQHFCTINVAAGPCPGDSGGPLVYKKKIVGIVNFGDPIKVCQAGEPNVFAKVSHFAKWIKKQLSM